jgi:hypothetical protein
MVTETEKKIPAVQWGLLYGIIFGLSYSQEALFSSNQNTKFITGLALAGYGDIAADWMARITDPFPLFSHLLKWQYQLLGLYAGTHLSFFLIVGAYGILGVQLAKSFFERTEDRQRALWVFSLLWLLIHIVGVRNLWSGVFPEGLAGQYMLGDYYQPCCFGVLLLAGIAAYSAGRILPASACFMLGPLFHPAYLISSALIAAALIILPANRGLGIGWGKRLLFLFLVGVTVGACTVYNFYTLTSSDPVIRDTAHKIMAETRIPQHALPSEWKITQTALFFMAGCAAAWLGRKRLVGQLLFVLVPVVASSVLWAAVFYNPTVAVAAPWRVSVFLAPLSWMLLLAALATWIARRTRQKLVFPLSARGKKWLVLAGICACSGGVLHLGFDYARKTHNREYGLTRFLAGYHTSGNQYLVPPEQTHIRLEAGVPVFATWKSHPTRDSEFLEWYEKIEIARTLYGGRSEGAQEALKAVLGSHTVTHVVWPQSKGAFPFPQMGKQVFGDSHFSLWELNKTGEPQL